ncbi:MAG: hypothetical protein GY936_13115 [Ignavibacteriae bacterium]|nr:hypothetical protein [Ignavibacteriota bacterium]
MYLVLPNEENEIIFLGDSITDRCEWFELFSYPLVRNRGLSGDKTSGVLDRLTEITESKPDKVFIMIGVNDLRHNIDADSIVSNYIRIIETIISDSPDTKIIFQSVLPVNSKIGKPKTTNQQVDSLNSSIQAIAKRHNIPYVDINSKLKDAEGRLDEKFSEDGLHINGAAYLVWKSVIEDYVNN